MQDETQATPTEETATPVVEPASETAPAETSPEVTPDAPAEATAEVPVATEGRRDGNGALIVN